MKDTRKLKTLSGNYPGGDERWLLQR